MIAVCIRAQCDISHSIIARLNQCPDPFVREKENKTKCGDQAEAAEIPCYKCPVMRVVFDRKYVCEWGLFEFGQLPFVAGFWRPDRYVFGDISCKCEDPRPFAVWRRHVQNRNRVVVLT